MIQLVFNFSLWSKWWWWYCVYIIQSFIELNLILLARKCLF